ncbi:uncharacterized protein [Drosophila bipectinata]|uniref:uncharacterized protein n=1 Tax=Drosophila bipectinata TaxID=42026 RepID=UPI001C8911D3|nr:uncharacterized protein LOC108122237 [Drosophila bipectinata]
MGSKPDPLPIFIFDVIITKLEANDIQLTTPSKLEVLGNFFKTPFEMAPSQINVTDFQSGYSLEFQNEPKEIRKNVATSGISFKISYNKKGIGSSQAYFPQHLLDTLDRDMSDIIHSDRVNITRGDEVTGKLEFLARLVIKCVGEPEPDCFPNMGSTIAPQDIMFLIGHQDLCPIPCERCSDVIEDEAGDERLRLDLSRYKSRLPKTPRKKF